MLNKKEISKVSKLIPISILILGLNACGGGSSNSTPEPLVGVFVDSAVSGLTYQTDSLSGVTNEDGSFNYILGENVVFSIGSLSFPSVPAGSQISPKDLAVSDTMSTNIARLLQSIDGDADPRNGITINPSIVSDLQVDFNVSASDFENNPDVINLVANSGSIDTSLISADAANTHLNFTLAFMNEDADIMIFSTGDDLQAAGGVALTGPQIEHNFRGRKFISLDGSFDWEFFVNGKFDGFDLDGTDQDYLDKAWSVVGNTLCRERGDKYPCVTVFALGNAFRLSLNGRDGTDGLEGWGIRYE